LRALTGCQLSAQAGRVGDEFALISALAERTPAFALEVGRDPSSIARTIDELIDRAIA
jgi:hypothetical protein